jgi:acetoacetyl-CoA synthetase
LVADTQHSDGVLNPSGFRFGSSEIYNVLSTPKFADQILDAIVVGQQRVSAPDEKKGSSDPTDRVMLFVKFTPAASSGTLRPKPEIEAAIRERISRGLSRRHVPEHIFETKEVPYNVNGKKLEIQVNAVVSGGEKAMAKLRVTA